MKWYFVLFQHQRKFLSRGRKSFKFFVGLTSHTSILNLNSEPVWYKKSISKLISEAEQRGEGTLKRTLSSSGLVALGIGASVGAGLFSLTGIGAGGHAGRAGVVSLCMAAIGCAFAGLCYAEFASMIPVAGSAYTYSYATMGEFMAWIIGWDLVLEYALASATVAVSWAQYVNELLTQIGYPLPPHLLAGP